jgi:hypothetical protein
VSDSRVLQPGPWRKTPGWRAGSWIIGISLLLLFLDWLTGDLFDVSWWRILGLLLLGLLLSVPYGWAWVKGRAPLPPVATAALVPQAAVQTGESGNTYVLVGPAATAPRRGLGRAARDLGPVSWFFYTLLWRWPLLMGDALLTAFWRGMTRLFGFNGGPSMKTFNPVTMDQVDYPEDKPPPSSRSF